MQLFAYFCNILYLDDMVKYFKNNPELTTGTWLHASSINFFYYELIRGPSYLKNILNKIFDIRI